ncbi:peroxidase 57 [Cryptomeria japonica]|uniref:peroxidase 57 n=1 Tax=Cryptomeria japonica TaxID=3369 RepID=UPI0027DA08FC|nr:peroxidase 57 [Cryptomeria japonica]XP_057858389.2 peroxidase 57 [Cryptomeria japonica]
MRLGIRCLACLFALTFALLISTNSNGFNTHRPYSLEEYTIRPGLHQDFYRHSCPQAEGIIKATINEMSANYPGIAPALIRLAFHDCFVEGCDASVLLDSVEGVFLSEKNSIPNLNSLRGYDIIDEIKHRLEAVCPETVSCADIIVLSARHAVVMTKGPFIPVKTGRRDSTTSFADLAESNLPSPNDEIRTMIQTFREKGFTAKEMVSLLGAHTVGTAHCRFFQERLTNFNGTGRADPTIDEHFRSHLSSLCSWQTDPAVALDNGSASSFDSHYYRNLEGGRGLLYVDQALMAAPITRSIVDLYASNQDLFYRDFSLAMVKLFNLNVLTGKQGQIRKECSKLVNNSRRSYDEAPFKDPEESFPF